MSNVRFAQGGQMLPFLVSVGTTRSSPLSLPPRPYSIPARNDFATGRIGC
jgi:hypothetical protein